MNAAASGALPIEVGGRMLDSAAASTIAAPPTSRRATSALPRRRPPTVGERVVIYLEGFGRVSGRVARKCGEGEVAIIFDFSAHKREKMAEQLTLAINKDLGIEETSAGDRQRRGNGRARV